jgi:integrase
MAAYDGRHQNQPERRMPGRIDCPTCARTKQVLSRSLSGDLLFSQAFKIWMSFRTLETNGLRTDARYLAATSERDYRCCARALERFHPFQRLPLSEIGPDELMDYQEARAVNTSDPAGAWWCVGRNAAHGPYRDRVAAEAWGKDHGGAYEISQSVWARAAASNRIRKEIGLMIRILRDARLWGQDEEDAFLRLRPVESEMVRAMTVDEQHRFLYTAASRLRYRLIYRYAIVALQTTAATNEMRALRIGDISLADRIIQVPPSGAKNKHRARAIPIVTEDCMWALEGLIARARELGSVQPSHYLFPKRINPGRSSKKASLKERYDPSRPMSDSGLKKQWDAVRKAALLPDLRIYDLRHTGITRMAEAGVPLPVAMTFAGHMTGRMQQRYTAICMAAKRGWGAAVWGEGMERAAVRDAAQAAGAEAIGAWPPRKPVLAESAKAYQTAQHFHSRA